MARYTRHMFGEASPAQTVESEGGSSFRRQTKNNNFDQVKFAGLLVLSSLFLYLQVFILPATPRLATGDQAIYLHDAARMLQGEMIYRDYDHFTFPGTDVFYMIFFTLFGVRAWIPQATLLVLGTAAFLLTTFISRKVIAGNLSFLPGLLYLALPFSSYLDATHHWFSMVAIAAALAVVMENRSLARVAAAGFLLGIATFFTQSSILVLLGFVTFLLWEQSQRKEPWSLLLKKESILVVSYLATVAASVAYFVWTAGLRMFLHFTLVFVIKYYPADWFNNWHVYLTGRPQLHVWTSWIDLPAFVLIHLAVPFIYIAFSIGVLKSKHPSPTLDRLMLINLTGVFLFLSVATAPAYSRLYVVSMPALILLICSLNSLPKIRSLSISSLWATVLVLFIARPLVTQIRWKAFLDLPTGRTAFVEPVFYDKCEWMSERTRPFDYFFGDHLIAFVLRLRNVSPVPFLRPTDYTRPEEVQATIRGLEIYKAPFVSWYKGLDATRKDGRHFQGDHLAPLRLYLRDHYHVAHTSSNGDQIWQRNQ